MCVRVGTHATAREWRSEGNFMEVILTSHVYVGLGDQAQVAGLWTKSLHLLNHLSRLTGRFQNEKSKKRMPRDYKVAKPIQRVGQYRRANGHMFV